MLITSHGKTDIIWGLYWGSPLIEAAISFNGPVEEPYAMRLWV